MKREKKSSVLHPATQGASLYSMSAINNTVDSSELASLGVMLAPSIERSKFKTEKQAALTDADPR